MQSDPSALARSDNRMERSSFQQLVPVSLDRYSYVIQSNVGRSGFLSRVQMLTQDAALPIQCNTSLARQSAESKIRHHSKNLLHNDEAHHRAKWLIQSAQWF